MKKLLTYHFLLIILSITFPFSHSINTTTEEQLPPPSDCPPGCSCSQVRIIGVAKRNITNCNGQGISNLPPEIDATTDDLIIERNKFAVLRPRMFMKNKPPLADLKKLNLAYNYVKEIDKNAFDGLAKLTDLNLFSNRLMAFPGEPFQKTPNLKVLNLAYNKIRVIKADTFKWLKKLETLYLYGCEIESIEDGAFVGMKNLDALSLEYNRLQMLSPATVNDLPRRMKELILSSNPWICGCELFPAIHFYLSLANQMSDKMPTCDKPAELNGQKWNNVSEDNFFCCPSGCTCQIKSKQIECDGRELKALPEIDNQTEVLLFSRNQLEYLSQDMLADLGNLRVVQLDGNQIRHVDRDAFKGLSNVEEVDLRNNQLERIDVELLKSIEGATFALTGNPWICDCSMRETIEYVVAQNPQYMPTCAKPEELADETWDSLSNEDFATCNNETDNSTTKSIDETATTLTTTLPSEKSTTTKTKLSKRKEKRVENMNYLLLNKTQKPAPPTTLIAETDLKPPKSNVVNRSESSPSKFQSPERRRPQHKPLFPDQEVTPKRAKRPPLAAKLPPLRVDRVSVRNMPREGPREEDDGPMPRAAPAPVETGNAADGSKSELKNEIRSEDSQPKVEAIFDSRVFTWLSVLIAACLVLLVFTITLFAIAGKSQIRVEKPLPEIPELK